MTNTRHYRTLLTVKLIKRDPGEFTVFSAAAGKLVVLKESEEFLGNWKNATIGREIDISVTTELANARGLVGYLSGGTIGGVVNG